MGTARRRPANSPRLIPKWRREAGALRGWRAMGTARRRPANSPRLIPKWHREAGALRGWRAMGTARRRPANSPRRAHGTRSEEHTSELQSRLHLVCRLLLEKKKNTTMPQIDAP